MNTHTLIVGGSKGIGLTTVRTLHGEGHRVSVISRHRPADADISGQGLDFRQTDITRPIDLKACLADIFDQAGPVDHLVFFQRFRGEGDVWTGEIETSLTATKNVIEGVTDHFSASAIKSITVISSIASAFIVDEQPVGYHMAKAALNQMVRFYAVKLGPLGIRVNSISPGTTVKDEAKEYYRQNTQLTSLIEGVTPLRRIGTADDVANTVSFLCSEKASFLTGNDLRLDGGLSLQAQETIARRLSLNDSSAKGS